MNNLTIKAFFEQSARDNANLPAVGMLNATPLTYNQLQKQISDLSNKLTAIGIAKGDKVAILSENRVEWVISYLALTTMGAVAVPILNDFSTKEIQTILVHSESKILLVSDKNLSRIAGSINLSFLQFVISIEDFRINQELSVCTPEQILQYEKPEETLDAQYDVQDNDLAVIIYTSGTTGNSKGVMLSHKNIISNIVSMNKIQPVFPTDRFISLLPLSHTLECTVGFLLPITHGAHITYPGAAPTASVLLPALQKVKPTILLSVPLIIEKIYFSAIAPKFSKGFISKLYKISIFRKLLNRVAGVKLKKTFGGQLHFFGIGGALLDARVEKFLLEAKFPYAIGYGLTETSPLLAGANPQMVYYRSTGPACEGVTLKIANPNKKTGEGEIWAKGDNVMLGYYKNDEATEKVFTPDGWFRTGDLGVFDKKGRLFIKGRLKNMILGPSGENIYPEEIESVINSHKLVSESVVYEFKGKLVAKVHLNQDELQHRLQNVKNQVHNLQDDMNNYANEVLEEIRIFVNNEVNKFSKLSVVIAQPTPFEKTPTLKIKKYLYTT